MTQLTRADPGAPMTDHCADDLGGTGGTFTILVSSTVSPLAVTKSTTIEYPRADDAEFVTVPRASQPCAPSCLHPVAATAVRAFFEATYLGTRVTGTGVEPAAAWPVLPAAAGEPPPQPAASTDTTAAIPPRATRAPAPVLSILILLPSSHDRRAPAPRPSRDAPSRVSPSGRRRDDTVSNVIVAESKIVIQAAR
jgi:hypothetical protein